MNERLLKKKIRSAVQDILFEQVGDVEDEREPKEKETKSKGTKLVGGATAQPGDIGIVKGSIGKGDYRAWVKSAKARAQKEPRALMGDLGVKSTATGDDLQQVLKILRVALNYNPTMREAYGGVREIQETLPDGGAVKAIAVTMSGVDHRNGKQFLMHTLQGAKNANFINPQGALGIGRGSVESTVIYSI